MTPDLAKCLEDCFHSLKRFLFPFYFVSCWSPFPLVISNGCQSCLVQWHHLVFSFSMWLSVFLILVQFRRLDSFLFYGIIHYFPYLLFYPYVLLFSFHDTRKNIILPRVLLKSFSLYGPTCQRRARPKEPDLPWRHFARSREQAMSLCLFWKRESHGLFRNYER